MPVINEGRNTLGTLLRIAAVGVALLTMLSCGDSDGQPAAPPTAPPGMFSTLPTAEPPVVGDQPPMIELNTPVPTPTPLPTPTPNPTGTPIPTAVSTPDPTVTPEPTLAPTPAPTSARPRPRLHQLPPRLPRLRQQLAQLSPARRVQTQRLCIARLIQTISKRSGFSSACAQGTSTSLATSTFTIKHR